MATCVWCGWLHPRCCHLHLFFPLSLPMFGIVIVVDMVVQVVVPMWHGVVWCGDVHVSQPTWNIFFYLSYFSLPLAHHMTLVEINAFSHQCATLLMPPPTPMANSHHHHYFQHQHQGWRQGVGDVDGRKGGLEMCLHLEPQVRSSFFLLY